MMKCVEVSREILLKRQNKNYSPPLSILLDPPIFQGQFSENLRVSPSEWFLTPWIHLDGFTQAHVWESHSHSLRLGLMKNNILGLLQRQLWPEKHRPRLHLLSHRTVWWIAPSPLHSVIHSHVSILMSSLSMNFPRLPTAWFSPIPFLSVLPVTFP